MTDTAASDAGRALAARRPRRPFVCEACGREYSAVVKQGRQNRACSSTCRSRLFREQKRANDTRNVTRPCADHSTAGN